MRARTKCTLVASARSPPSLGKRGVRTGRKGREDCVRWPRVANSSGPGRNVRERRAKGLRVNAGQTAPGRHHKTRLLDRDLHGHGVLIAGLRTERKEQEIEVLVRGVDTGRERRRAPPRFRHNKTDLDTDISMARKVQSTHARWGESEEKRGVRREITIENARGPRGFWNLGMCPPPLPLARPYLSNKDRVMCVDPWRLVLSYCYWYIR